MDINKLLKLQNINLENIYNINERITEINTENQEIRKYPVINSIIPITTDDIRFLPLLMEQLDKFCDRTVFIYSKYFFNQQLQDEKKMEYIKNLPQKLNLTKEYIFYEYEIDFSLKDELFIKPYYNSFKRYAINQARFEGFNLIDPKAEWTLLIDSDEIPDAELFLDWLNNKATWNDYKENNIYTLNFENYVYFWNESTQIINNENSIILLNQHIYKNKDEKYKTLFFSENERTAFYKYIPNKYKISNIKNNDLCMFHHYSWVRDEEKMCNKINNWTHSDDFKSIKVSYNDGSEQEIRLVTLSYTYAEYFGFNIFKDEIKEENLEIIEKSENDFNILQNIKSIEFYKYLGNPYINNFNDWLEKKSLEDNFLNYKVKNVKQHFICNGKYDY